MTARTLDKKTNVSHHTMFFNLQTWVSTPETEKSQRIGQRPEQLVCEECILGVDDAALAEWLQLQRFLGIRSS